MIGFVYIGNTKAEGKISCGCIQRAGVRLLETTKRQNGREKSTKNVKEAIPRGEFTVVSYSDTIVVNMGQILRWRGKKGGKHIRMSEGYRQEVYTDKESGKRARDGVRKEQGRAQKDERRMFGEESGDRMTMT